MVAIATAVTAFNTVVGVASLAFGVEGTFGEDPLEGKLDGIDKRLDDQAKKLTDLSAQVSSVRTDVQNLGETLLSALAIGIDEVKDRIGETALQDALADVDSAQDRLADFRLLEPHEITQAARDKVIEQAEDALNKVLRQLERPGDSFDQEAGIYMIGALTYAMSTRLEVAYQVESGIIGKPSITDGLSKAAGIIRQVVDGIEGYLSANVEVAGYFHHSGVFPGTTAPLYLPSIHKDVVVHVKAWSVLDPVERAEYADTNSDWHWTSYGDQFTTRVDTLIAQEVAEHGPGMRAKIVREDAKVLNLAALKDLGSEYSSAAEVNYEVGGNGRDVIEGRAWDNLIYGKGGSDEIITAWSHDVVFGGSGNDLITSLDGNNQFHGGAGRDTIRANDADWVSYGADTITGGAGHDRLFGGTGEDRMAGDDGRDYVHGGADDDGLSGGAGADTVLGGRGDDWIFGERGADLLLGHGGRDTIEGGGGNDTMTGGGGADRFVFASGARADTGDDVITDFELGLDTILLQRAKAGSVSVRHEDGDTLVTHRGGTILLEEVTAQLEDLGL